MSLKDIFDVFSKRPEAAAKAKHEVPQTTRYRVLMWCDELFGNRRTDSGTIPASGGARLITRGGDYRGEFWSDISRRLLYRTGGTQSTPSGHLEYGAIHFVSTCPAEEFLNFLEDIFKVDCGFQVGITNPGLVDELNVLLRQDDLPYHITYFVEETVQQGSSLTICTRAFPRVIMKESEIVHANAIAPALTLLRRPYFRSANDEFLAALEDYRAGKMGDCLTKCGSAFESVLKIICDRKGWPYKTTDTAKPLIETVVGKSKLDGYFEQPLIIIATLRNRLSTAHGAGTTVKQPAAHIAQYALNATASAIILLAQETGEY